MCEDERLSVCGTCYEESCTCHEVCDKCKGWKEQCSCVTEPILAHWCKDCDEFVEIKLEVVNSLNDQLVFPICSACAGEKVIRVDEMIDAAEYSKGDR